MTVLSSASVLLALKVCSHLAFYNKFARSGINCISAYLSQVDSTYASGKNMLVIDVSKRRAMVDIKLIFFVRLEQGLARD